MTTLSSFLVLSWFKIKLLWKTKYCRKQINYSRYFAYPFEMSHRKRNKIFNFFFSGVWVIFSPFHKNNPTHTLTNLRKILKNLLPSMVFPSCKSTILFFLLLGKYQCACSLSSIQSVSEEQGNFLPCQHAMKS